MSEKPRPAPLTFPDADRSPLSIRAKALVFFDPRSHRVREELERLAPQGQPVLIEGETGTGKELLARQIHRHSERAGLFVAVSCSALSRNHAEAELFGYAPGAHNGPVGSRAGWFGSANGGTLYLDEIADLPLTLQARLLQTLEEREVLRVGDLVQVQGAAIGRTEPAGAAADRAVMGAGSVAEQLGFGMVATEGAATDRDEQTGAFAVAVDLPGEQLLA
ncbi:sigma 54-interacting transcriptional regulator, partial [Pseudomonas aeruginosa]|uniref:sigma 54-interacting transcriptional regulator n=2 Tax=Pseudomonas aeruginosa TaxID=287 RepID=UPI003C7A625E